MNNDWIDPNNILGGPDGAWANYIRNLSFARQFHDTLKDQYHPHTYVIYGADKEHKAWGNINRTGWSGAEGNLSDADFAKAAPRTYDDRVTVYTPDGKRGATLAIPDAEDLDDRHVGDGTVPYCSGNAPFERGGDNIKQSFPMTGFDHQHAYDNDTVRWATLYSIEKILASIE
ncbi:hypothetical protein [Robbsia andropogonis]|uniref:hypothetical protein n=1 Tax=Robbsia andropogonis TaxID=28092 RepID=UPI0012FB7A97|nr:hypothetical protein [Robbsia andropogonis]